MAQRLIHILDETASEDGVRLLSLLLEEMPAGQIEQQVLTLGPKPPTLTLPPAVKVFPLGRRLSWPLISGPDLKRFLKAHPADLVHAWSAPAAVLAKLAWPGQTRVTASLTDPSDASTSSKWLRSLGSGEASGLTIVCPSQFLQRRLVESGIPLSATTIIRPGVAFSAIRQARETFQREALGLSTDNRVLLTMSPPTRPGGHFIGMWATAILHQIWPGVRLIIPGQSREQRRLKRLGNQINCPEVFIFTEDTRSPAELLAVSDVLIAPAVGEVSVGWLSWAMAAGVPIVGSAVPAIAELIADRHNGLLCRAGEPHTLATRIRMALESPDLLRRCVQTAQGQAYEVFRVQACVEQYLRLFQNVLEGRDPAAGIQDRGIEA